MSPLDPAALPEKYNITEAQNRDFKNAVMSMFKGLKEEKKKIH